MIRASPYNTHLIMASRQTQVMGPDQADDNPPQNNDTVTQTPNNDGENDFFYVANFVLGL